MGVVMGHVLYQSTCQYQSTRSKYGVRRAVRYIVKADTRLDGTRRPDSQIVRCLNHGQPNMSNMHMCMHMYLFAHGPYHTLLWSSFQARSVRRVSLHLPMQMPLLLSASFFWKVVVLQDGVFCSFLTFYLSVDYAHKLNSECASPVP